MAITGGRRLHGAAVSSGGDHRMAMALAVAALVAAGETLIDDVACVATSFPAFADTINMLAGVPTITVEP
jgi:3-phosphoshikimate 1-carboxyvinyltransferase